MMNAQEKSAQLKTLRAEIERNPDSFVGKTARERLTALFDEGTFVEVGAFVRQRSTELGVSTAPEAVVTGYGAVNGALVFAFAQDPSIRKGALSEMHAKKISTILSMALKADAPIVSMLDSCGMLIGEGIDALAGYGEILSLCSEIRGSIPHICVVCGVCAGASSFLAAFADYTVMLKNAELFLSAPSVVSARFGTESGDATQAYENGLASVVCETEDEAIGEVKRLLDVLSLPLAEDDANRLTPNIETILSSDGYDMRDVIREVADGGVFTEFSGGAAKNIVTGLIALDGVTCGVVANQPAVNDGALDSKACAKAAKFIEFCDNFELPVVSFVDTEGFAAARGEDIAESAQLLSAYTSCESVKLTLIVGKAFGAGYLSMGSKTTGADVVLAYPTAQIAALPADTGATFLGTRQIENADQPAEKREELIAAYASTMASPYLAAARGQVDDMIDIASTRQLLISSLNLFLDGDGE